LLESRYGTALFRAFLVIEHAEENLDFILKVDKYKTTENLQKRQRMAWDMYRDYIAVGAKHELNLDSMSRKVTTLAMITPHLTTFDTAKARIMNLLSNDAYMRFLNWNIYQDLANQQQPKKIFQKQLKLNHQLLIQWKILAKIMLTQPHLDNTNKVKVEVV